MPCFLGWDLAALLHSGHRSVGGGDGTQHLQTGDPKGQALRRAGRTSTTTTADAEVRDITDRWTELTHGFYFNLDEITPNVSLY